MEEKAPDGKDAILTRVEDAVATVTLNRPAKMNAVTHRMWLDLAACFTQFQDDPGVRVIVLRGTGGHFCAGADIGEFDQVRRDAGTARDYEAANSAAFAAIRNAPMPTLAAVSGNCFGGGFGLAAACDLRIASPDALFAVPAAKLGLAYPRDAMADIVHAAGPQMARYLTYSAARIDAEAAFAAGFLLEIAAGNLDARASEIARAIAGNAPLSIRASKAAIRAVLSGRAEDEERAQALGDATFDSADYAEGRAAFRERREAHFTGR